MTQQETIDQILVEIGISNDGVPDKDQFVSFEKFTHYATLLYGVGFDAGRDFNKNTEHSHNGKKVIKLKNGKQVGEPYNNMSIAAEKMDVNRTSIKAAVYNPNRTCKGFHWEFYKLK